MASICLLVVLVRRSIPPATDNKWSKPIKISHAEKESFSAFSLHRWNGTVVGMRPSGHFYFLSDNGRWAEKVFSVFETNIYFPVAVDARGPTAVFSETKFTENKAGTVTSLINATMAEVESLRVDGSVRVQDYVGDLFQDPRSGPGFTQEISLLCGEGTLRGSEWFIPYSAQDFKITVVNKPKGPTQVANRVGPAKCGLFFSPDAGLSLQKSPLWTAIQQTIRATSNQLYLLATDGSSKIWSSTRLPIGLGWSQPELVVDTLTTDRFLAEPENETLHLCWMDMRLKKGLGFYVYGSLEGPDNDNNLVFYRNRSDADGTWSKETKLSGNLSRCRSPAISAEGQRVVVVWQHYVKAYTRAVIYYAFSKNNGQTWTKPRRIENFEGTSAESPQVILYQGIIHLFYDRSEWPNRQCDLMYQRREFPEK
jgi:hypothetical protein